ncbi:hypothetical protein AB205_0021810 [Aquarana catesbeiana]|uniref:Hsp90 co-chaperone Cdc37 n=1 Tax=Aquarana catesbeiana TaxID=8400 RepID=A0A2G9P2V8_AQUCT|nr:hypothetical protein AB205_0021810 [Aquarana catesbeiana]
MLVNGDHVGHKMEKHALMEQVAHQTIVMQFILELAKSLKVDPRACFRQFFTKIKTADQQYMDAFNDELESFKGRVRERAKVRIEKALKEYEEEERKKRLGPGGLDPVEVYETLPPELQKCFDSKDIEMLKETISKMDPKHTDERIFQSDLSPLERFEICSVSKVQQKRSDEAHARSNCPTDSFRRTSSVEKSGHVYTA